MPKQYILFVQEESSVRDVCTFESDHPLDDFPALVRKHEAYPTEQGAVGFRAAHVKADYAKGRHAWIERATAEAAIAQEKAKRGGRSVKAKPKQANLA